MQTFVAVLIRIVLVAAGLVFAVSLAVVATLVIALWGVRSAWARLTGRPVVPFVVRIDPRAGFGWMNRGVRPRRAEPAAAAQRPAIRDPGDVTDVEAKPPRAG